MNEQPETPRRASGLARGSNRGRLVEVLRRQGPSPRVELARSTGLSFPAISAITSRLMAEELLCEAETETAMSWQRGVTLDDGEKTAEAEVIIMGNTGKNTWLVVSIHEGKNRQIHRTAEALGFNANLEHEVRPLLDEATRLVR